MLLYLLVALPTGLVGGFALAGTFVTLERVLAGAQVSLSPLLWKASIGIALTALACFALVGIVRQFRTPDRAISIRTASDPNPKRIESNARSSIKVRWIATGLWNAISFSATITLAVQQRGRGWSWLWVLILPAWGVVYLAYTARAARNFRRHADAWLELSPPEPARGAPLELRFAFEGPAPVGSFRVTLQCIEVWRRARSIYSELRGQGFATVWSESREVTPVGRRLSVVFVPPESAYPSHDAWPHPSHHWRADLQYPGEDEPRSFHFAVR